ncbi:hypothetical protein V4C55_43810, partial [Paraburkholderia sabiae]
ATLLAHQAHCALSDFRGKLRYLLVHGSILSRVGASTKSGAVHGHPDVSGLGNVRWVVERTHAWLHHFRRLHARMTEP